VKSRTRQGGEDTCMVFRKKEKRIAPWRQHILSHHQPKASTKERGDFPREVIKELIEEAGGRCQICLSSPDTTTHHVMPRARKGRGMKTNGLRCCYRCHDRVQTHEEDLQYWIQIYRQRYGEHFWFDEKDWYEYNKKQLAIREAEEVSRQHLAKLQPIVMLLATATGRELYASEMRFLNLMNEREISVFEKMLQDMIKN
jgi:5-methylcytosine-specific restriction endonuclease McrA